MVTFKKYSTKPNMNLTPMIDMVFLLLIFFLLTASFLKNEGIPINLPQAKTGIVHQEQAPLIVFVDKEGRIFFNNHQISVNSLLNDLSSISHPKGLIIKSDQQAPAGIVVKVIDRARLAGIKRVILATHPEN